jgi:hypothetical protein
VIFSSFVKSLRLIGITRIKVYSIYKLNVFYTSCVVCIRIVSQFFKHFIKVEKITIRCRWIALSDLRTTGPKSSSHRVMFCRAFFKNWSVGRGASSKRDHIIAFNSRAGGGRWSGGIVPWKMFVFFFPYDCNSPHFLKQIFGYTALHYAVDRLNLQLCTCIVCLCRYHNLVTQGTSLINLDGPPLP